MNQLKQVLVSSLIPGNPKEHPRNPAKEMLYSRLDPNTMPPIRVRNNVIIDGHHRWRRAKSLGMKYMWAYVQT